MAITVISGPAKSGKTTLAKTLRDNMISNRRGCLLLDETTEGDPKHLIEKIIVGEQFPDNVANISKVEPGFNDKGERDITKDVILRGLDALPWKKDPLVIVVGDKGKALLAEIEKVCPGFVNKFGPATGTSTTIEDLDLSTLVAPAVTPNG